MSKKRKTDIATTTPTDMVATEKPTAPDASARAPRHELILAAGLGLLIAARPWFDGLTWPELNVYFVWLACILFALWSTRLLFRRETLQYPVPTILFVLFLLIAWTTGQASVLYASTYRALLDWAGYLMIFIIAASGLRSRTAVAVILSCFVLTSFGETIWAILQVKYRMPYMREAAKDPAMLLRYFGTTEMTEAIRSRIESNRATGSLLMANSLACWTLVAIPFAAGGVMHAWLRLRDRARATVAHESAGAGTDVDRNVRALIVGALVGFMFFVAVSLYYTVFISLSNPLDSVSNYPVRWTVYCVAIPIAAGLWAYATARKHGGLGLWFRLQLVALVALFVIQVVGLALTYSRGGMLATMTALSLGAWLVWSGSRRTRGKTKHAAAVLASLLLACAIVALGAFGLPASAGEGPDAPDTAPTQPDVQLEGVNPSLDAMMNPATALLRLSYWKSGLRMALANPLTGVGLGNFGAVYPVYQLPNSADVKQAHNDYLQLFCETGVFGGLAFIAFWAYFFVWGVQRIRREPDRADRWLLSGVFCGTMGFVFHAGVDFNFPNASLATLAFLLAGLFFSLGREPGAAALRQSWSPLAGVPLLLAAAVVFGATYRVYLLDETFGNDLQRRTRLDVAVRLLDPENVTKQPLPDQFVSMLIPSREARESFANFYVRLKPGSTSVRAVSPQEPVPEGAILKVVKAQEAAKRVMERIPEWLTIFIDADSRFPYDPTASTHIYLWYQLLYEHAAEPANRVRYAEECLRWAEECVRRSPKQVAYRNLLARALWRRGTVETTMQQLDYYDRAIEQFAKAIELYPSRPDVYFDYAERCISYGQERQRAGDTTGGQTLIEKGNAARRQGEELQEARQDSAPA